MNAIGVTLRRNLIRDGLAALAVIFTLYFVWITAEMNRDVPPNAHLHVHAATWQTHAHFMRARH